MNKMSEAMAAQLRQTDHIHMKPHYDGYVPVLRNIVFNEEEGWVEGTDEEDGTVHRLYEEDLKDCALYGIREQVSRFTYLLNDEAKKFEWFGSGEVYW
jgi:hypothetical protein